MRFIRAVLAGIVGGFLAAVVCLVAEFVLTAEAAGSGGLGSVSAGAYYFQFAAVLGFAAGFSWQFKQRTGRSQSATRQ
jgi:hypothetical protein